MLVENELVVSGNLCNIPVFTVYTKLAEMVLLALKDLTTAKKLPPVELDLIQEIITG